MSNLSVLERDGALVVDSRLIAQELGIEHRALLQTIDKYLNEIQEFGVVTFEMSKPLEGSKGGRPERFAFLNEEQSSYLMTLSRNTDQVRAAKRNLVKAFSEAKRVIKQILPAQSQEIDRLKLELALAQTRERLVASTQALALINPALPALAFGQPDAVVQVEIPTTVLVDEQGRIVEQCDGCSITWLAKRYGFGTGRKATEQCKAWLASLGIKDQDWVEEMSAHTTRKLPRQVLPFLDRQFSGHGGDRQRYIGEVN